MQVELDYDNELATLGPSLWTIAQLHLLLPIAPGGGDLGMISKPLTLPAPDFLSLPVSRKTEGKNTILESKLSLPVNIVKNQK